LLDTGRLGEGQVADGRLILEVFPGGFDQWALFSKRQIAATQYNEIILGPHQIKYGQKRPVDDC
jgi:hypothetical protein